MKRAVFSNIYPFVIYKDYNKRTTAHDSKIYTNKNTGFYISKTRTNMGVHATLPNA